MGSPYTPSPHVLTSVTIPADVTDLRNVASVNPAFAAALDMCSANLARCYPLYDDPTTPVDPGIPQAEGAWPASALTLGSSTGHAILTDSDRFVVSVLLGKVAASIGMAVSVTHSIRIVFSVDGGANWVGCDGTRETGPAPAFTPESSGTYQHDALANDLGRTVQFDGSVLAVSHKTDWGAITFGLQQRTDSVGGTGTGTGIIQTPIQVRICQFCMGT